jgi:SAM-dependent methyltransferase
MKRVAPMTQTDSANTAQIEHWNTRAGQTWVKFQEALDRQVEPLGLAAMTTLQPKEGEHILDIGCGCGQTSVDLARLVGATGSVLGVDISQPMLEVAQRRPLPARNLHVIFEQLDAQSGDLGHERFDAVFSRFGVMFFSDPVAAFVNIRKALKPAGRLAFVCWRPLEQNPWMHAPLDAAFPLLPPLPPPDPTAPGPFAFADAGRVEPILTAARFGSVKISQFDATIGGGDLEQTLELALNLGPLGAVLRENPNLTESVAGVVRDALSKYATPKGVLMPAAVWIVSAHR